MLTKDLLRVTRAGGGYRPRFADDGHIPLAARVIGAFEDHVGSPRAALEESLTTLEREAEDYKLVRGFAKLVERDAAFETRAPLDPERARRVAFDVAAERAVVTESERADALAAAADRLQASPEAVTDSLYADREPRQVLAAFEPRWDAESLLVQYNLSLAQTALFDATEVRVRSADPGTLVSAVKRLRLLYEIRRTGEGREVVVTGPDALFRRSRRYGTRFARLLRTVAKAREWRLEATIDDRGTERELVLADGDVAVPGTEPVAEPTYDSGVEAEFAARFSALELPWRLVREPEPLEAGANVVIPDFALDWAHGEFRVYLEIVGFWTPEYIEKKLSRLDELEAVEMIVAVDESLGVGERLEAGDHRVVPYSGSVRVKDVRDALRPYESALVAESAASLPDELVPDGDVVTLAALAAAHGVDEAAIEEASFPAHERVGRTLVRPAVLESLRDRLQPGMDLAEAERVLDEYGVEDVGATLAALGYRVEWEDLGGGTVREK